MKQIFYFSLFFISSLILVLPFFSITGYDTVVFSSGSGGEVSTNPNPSVEGSLPSSDDGTTSTSGTSGSSDSGDGAAGGGVPISLNPSEFNLNMAINTNIEKNISVTNTGTSKLNLSIRTEKIGGMTILGQDFIDLDPSETKSFKVVFVALGETGIFTGKIKIGGKEVLITLNVKTKLLLFDSNIVVLNENYQVPKGSRLKTEVTLIPLGDDDRLDITLNYIIKDFEGNVHYTKSETILVDKEVTFKRNFQTGNLPLGKYVIGLEVVYPNGIATSSSQFEVVEGFLFGAIIYSLIVLILMIGISIVVIMLNQVARDKEINNNQNAIR